MCEICLGQACHRLPSSRQGPPTAYGHFGSGSRGLSGAFFRVHHYARQAAAPIPLLSAAGARTKRIEVGTGVIDMR